MVSRTATPNGLERLRHVRRMRTEMVTDLLDDWSDEERRSFDEILGKYYRKYYRSVAWLPNARSGPSARSRSRPLIQGLRAARACCASGTAKVFAADPVSDWSYPPAPPTAGLASQAS